MARTIQAFTIRMEVIQALERITPAFYLPQKQFEEFTERTKRASTHGAAPLNFSSQIAERARRFHTDTWLDDHKTPLRSKSSLVDALLEDAVRRVAARHNIQITDLLGEAKNVIVVDTNASADARGHAKQSSLKSSNTAAREAVTLPTVY